MGDSGVRCTYENRAKFQFPDSGPYFFDRMDAMIAEGYIPTQQDVLRSRVRTTGIVETSFEIEGNNFKMFDVGGQRNERKKWIHCFENVSCVVFVAAISEYDQVLFEDDSTNRVTEALNLFDHPVPEQEGPVHGEDPESEPQQLLQRLQRSRERLRHGLRVL